MQHSLISTDINIRSDRYLFEHITVVGRVCTIHMPCHVRLIMVKKDEVGRKHGMCEPFHSQVYTVVKGSTGVVRFPVGNILPMERNITARPHDTRTAASLQFIQGLQEAELS